MENYTAERIRQEFLNPLIGLVGEFTTLLTEMQRMSESGELPKDYVPLNTAMALKGLGNVRKLKREFHDKLEGIRDGAKIYRETELKRAKERREAERRAKKSKT